MVLSFKIHKQYVQLGHFFKSNGPGSCLYHVFAQLWKSVNSFKFDFVHNYITIPCHIFLNSIIVVFMVLFLFVVSKDSQIFVLHGEKPHGKYGQF